MMKKHNNHSLINSQTKFLLFVNNNFDWLFFIPFMLLSFLFRHSVPKVDTLHTSITIGIFTLGIVLQFLVVNQLHTSNDLKQTGMYAICRHPLLISRILCGLSMSLLLKNIIGSSILIIFLIVNMIVKIRRNENNLSKQFPESWTRYKKKVNMILPSIFNMKDILDYKMYINLDKARDIWIYYILSFVSITGVYFFKFL